MIRKAIKIKNLDTKSDNSDLEYWLSKSVKDRVSTVEYLRRQYNGSAARLQRVVRVIQQTSS
jgi:hypothetical protein